MKYLVRFLFVLFFIIGLQLESNAQFPSLPLDPVDPNPDPDVPIDGGVSIMVAAGVAYGLKKINDKRKQNNINDIEN